MLWGFNFVRSRTEFWDLVKVLWRNVRYKSNSFSRQFVDPKDKKCDIKTFVYFLTMVKNIFVIFL